MGVEFWHSDEEEGETLSFHIGLTLEEVVGEIDC
jgi:hypothetical protein